MPSVTIQLSPGSITAPVTQPVFYSTQGTVSSDGTPITYNWSLTVPVGSSEAFIETYSNGEVVGVYSDVNGVYVLTVRATSASGAIATKTVELFAVSDTKYIHREKNSMPSIGENIGDFWKRIDNKEVFQSLWDEYAKCSANAYRYVADTYLSKSINTIQDTKSVTDKILSTKVEIPTSGTYIKLAKTFYGTAASTALVPAIVEEGLTDTVYVLSSDIGGDEFFSKKSTVTDVKVYKSGVLSFSSPQTWFSFANIRFLNGRATGKRSSVVYSNGKYRLSPNIPSIVGFDTDSVLVKAKIEAEPLYKDLLFTVDDISAPIQTISYVTIGTSTYAKIKLSVAIVPAGKTNLPWRLCNTLTQAGIDFSKEGVSYGDTLRLQLNTSIEDSRVNVDCHVVGAYKDKLCFEFSDTALKNTSGLYVDATIADKTYYDWFTELGIPGATQTNSTYQFTSVAAELKTAATVSPSFHVFNTIYPAILRSEGSTRFNTIVATAVSYNRPLMRIGYEPLYVKRNSKLPLATSDSVVSCDVLTEFVYQKQAGIHNNKFVLVHEDGTVVNRDLPEKLLVQNVDFFVLNKGSFSFTDFSKASGSYIITSQTARFITRQAMPGDALVNNGVTYYIKSVISETEVELVRDANSKAIVNIIFASEYAYVRKRLSTEYNYIIFSKDTYSHPAPAPDSLFAPSIVLDNSNRIQNNFGVLTDYTLKEYLDFSSPQVAYLSAVKGLMFCLVNGPTIASVQAAACLLTNSAITEYKSIVRQINYNTGKVIVERLDENTNELLGIHDTFTVSTGYIAKPLSTISLNKDTDTSIAVGDTLSAFTPITGGVLVVDYYTYPELFDHMPLKKYHTWFALLNADEVESKDIPFMRSFFELTKPIYTKLEILYILTLRVDVQTVVDLDIEGELRLTDDSSLSAEYANMLDSRNNSGQILRLLDDGELETRTLFLGRDLVANSSTEITSERGGFTLLNAPASIPTYLSGDVKILDRDAPFSGSYYVRGKNLVKAGDILRIYTGVNAGIYSITAVSSDTQLEITPLSGRLPHTPLPLTVSSVEADFGIYRIVTEIILSGISPSSLSGIYGSSFSGATFNWDRVTPGDVLINTSDYTDRAVIENITYDPSTEDAAYKLVTNKTLSTSKTYIILREFLLEKAYAQKEAITFSSSEPDFVEHSISKGYAIREGDTLVVASGANIGQEAKITFVGHNYFYIDSDVLTSGCTVTLEKRWLPTLENSDKRLEYLHGHDNVSAVLESTGPIANVTSNQQTNNGENYRTVTGVSILQSNDVVKLYNGSTLVFSGRVWKLTGSGAVCIRLSEDSSINTSTQYSITIERYA